MAANFNNVGVLLNKAFTHAKQLGVKTALGTETPMGVTDTLESGRNARNLLDKEEVDKEPIITIILGIGHWFIHYWNNTFSILA